MATSPEALQPKGQGRGHVTELNPELLEELQAMEDELFSLDTPSGDVINVIADFLSDRGGRGASRSE